MKNFFMALLLLCCLGTFAQDFTSALDIVQSDSPKRSVEDYGIDDIGDGDSQEAFKKAALENGLPQRTFKNLVGVENGYYLISGVFRKTNKLDRKIKKLNKKGLDAGYLLNPENGLNYFYVKQYKTWQVAIEDSNTNFDNRFDDEVWILQVLNSSTPKGVSETLEIKSSVKDKNLKPKKPFATNQTIKKADEYFSKMWYAEASTLYEEALLNKKNYSYEVLQKAGDAHYFNTNMEEAYKWYDILFDEYEDQMTADNIFKYAHALKGTGKYGRSKRLMRIYNKKMIDSDNIIAFDERQELDLDEILNATVKFEINNLSTNSKYSDFAPMYYNEGNIVFASAVDSSILKTRRYKWDNQPYLDLYTAKINTDSTDISNAQNFSKQLNSKYHEAGVTFSPDNKIVYFTRNNYGKKLRRDNKGVNHLKIYVSTREDDKWSEATELPFNSDDYSTGHPALSKDGKKLYFVSDMPGSMGDTDIFVVDVLEDGTFSTPKNLGPEINTEQKEMFPFINEDALYFSSNGHTGLGGLDIFKTILDEEKGFSPVINLGMPINSNKDDFSYIINEKSQKGFFASNRDGGKGHDDIYSFKLLEDENDSGNSTIAGIVTDLITKDVINEALVALLDENSEKLNEVLSKEDGSYIFEGLEADKLHTIRTTKATYFMDEQQVTTVENDTIEANVALKKLKKMIVSEDGIRKLKTDMIYFDFDKSYIREDASKELNKLIEVMTEYPNMVIKIESHTDARGNAAYNDYLSDRRAKSTREYIISQGIDASRIQSAIGYGEQNLLNGCGVLSNCSQEQHAANRRSEFIVVSM